MIAMLVVQAQVRAGLVHESSSNVNDESRSDSTPHRTDADEHTSMSTASNCYDKVS